MGVEGSDFAVPGSKVEASCEVLLTVWRLSEGVRKGSTIVF